MEQPTPPVTADDVERIVRRDFPPDTFGEVMAVLKQYGMDQWQREAHRVRLAALKLAGGNPDELRRWIEWAKSDYRDVLAPAEYPGYLRKWSSISNLAETDRDRIIEADWKQYETWLRKT